MIAAIGSGERSANCLGTSSPMISEAKVVTTMTMPKPIVRAVSGSIPSKAIRCDTGMPRLAPE